MGTIFGDIRFKRGLEENLPSLEEGQPAFTKDTKRVFIGGDEGNVEIPTKRVVDDIAINVKHPPAPLVGAKGDGVTDDTEAINNIIALGKNVFFPEPDVFYNITDTIIIKFPGQILFSNGHKRGMIRNVTNYKQLVVFGDTTVDDGGVPQAGIKGLTFYGNEQTVGGIRIDGAQSSNPNWTDASKDCILRDVAVDNIGNGWALEVYSWCNEISNFTAYTGNKRGVLFAKEHNQNNIDGMYITGCTEQSLQIGGDGSTLRGRGNIFNGIVVQQSGGAEGCIVISDADNLVMNGIYLEKNNLKGAPVPIMIKDTARGTLISGVSNLGGGALVVRNQGIGTLVKGVVSSNVTGAIVENSASGQMIAEGINWIPEATATVPKFSDLSTAGTGLFIDPVDGFKSVKISDYAPTIEFIDKSVSAYNWQQYADGNQIQVKYDSLQDGTYEGTAWRFNASVPEMVVDGIVRAETDNVRNLGSSSRRWSNIYAGTSTINTSDQREKQQIESINETVLRAWGKVTFTQFKFDNAVELKGSAARWHFGVIAQQVKEAFESEGLNPFEYGLLCYDEWLDQYETDEAGNQVLVMPAGNRYGIRYDEALALECAYLRSKLG